MAARVSSDFSGPAPDAVRRRSPRVSALPSLFAASALLRSHPTSMWCPGSSPGGLSILVLTLALRLGRRFLPPRHLACKRFFQEIQEVFLSVATSVTLIRIRNFRNSARVLN